jgi:hypothetical protein
MEDGIFLFGERCKGVEELFGRIGVPCVKALQYTLSCSRNNTVTNTFIFADRVYPSEVSQVTAAILMCPNAPTITTVVADG